MNRTNSDRRNSWLWPLALFSLTAFAFGLRWYYVSTAVVLGPVRGDAAQYYAYAWNLVHRGVFAVDAATAHSVMPDNYRDPGYPVLLALWMSALGNGATWYAAVLMSQAAIGALTVGLIAQLGKNWLSERWSFGAGVMLAAWPHAITMCGFLLSETLFGFLCTLALVLTARALRLQNLKWAGIAGAAFGAAALTNAVLMPFGVLAAGFLAWRKLAPGKICIALAAGALLLPGVWAIRNAQLPRGAIDHSSTDRALQNLVQGTWPEYHSAWRASVLGDPREQAQARATLQAIDTDYSELRNTPRQGSEAILQRLGRHPMNTIIWYLIRKPWQFWSWDIQIGQGDIYAYPTTQSPFQMDRVWIAWEVIFRAINPLVLLLAIIGIWIYVKRPMGQQAGSGEKAHGLPTATAVAGLLAFVTLVYTLLQAEPRYSIPFRGPELLLALTGAAQIAALTARYRKRSSGRSSNTSNGSW